MVRLIPLLGASFRVLPRAALPLFATVGVLHAFDALMAMRLVGAGPTAPASSGSAAAEAAFVLPEVPWLATAASLMWGMLASAAAMVVVAMKVRTGRVHAPDALATASRRLPSLLGASLLLFGGAMLLRIIFVALTVLPGALRHLGLLGIVPLLTGAVFIAIAWFGFEAAAVLGGKGPVACFRAAAELTRGHRLPIFGVLFLLGILQAPLDVGGAVAAGVDGAAPTQGVMLAIQWSIGTFLASLIGAFTALFWLARNDPDPVRRLVPMAFEEPRPEATAAKSAPGSEPERT